MNIATSIRVLCAKQRKTQKQLAEHLNITPQYLWKIMKDNRFVRDNRLSEMAVFFEVPVSDFIKEGE
jgi:transcriptional regulator with XRE-family HTH domain